MRSWVSSTSAAPAGWIPEPHWSSSCPPGALPFSEDSRCPENQLEGGAWPWAPGHQSGKTAAAGQAELAFLTFVERGRP